MRKHYDAAWERIAALDLSQSTPASASIGALRTGRLVIDAGSGAGEADAALAERFARVVAVDFASAHCVAVRAARPDVRVERVAADLEQGLPIAAGSADALVALDVVEHLIDPAAFLAEAARVVKAGGQMLLSTVNARFIGHWASLARGRLPRSIDDVGLLAGVPAPHHGHLSLFTRGELDRWLRASGFLAERWEPLAVGGGTWTNRLPRKVRLDFLAQGFWVLARRNTQAIPVRHARDVSVIVVAHDSGDDLVGCLDALRDSVGPVRVAQILVVDNASTDRAVVEARARFPEIEVLRNDANVGFGTAVNRAAREARHPRLLVLNADVRLARGALVALEAMFASDPTVAAAGGLLLRPGGDAALSWAHFPSLRVLAAWRAARRGWARLARRLAPRIGAAGGGPVGACVLLDRAAFLDAGGFDEGFFLYAEEIDLYERLRASGRTVVSAPYVVATHREGGSARNVPASARVAWIESHRRLLRKHGRPWAAWAFDRWVADDPGAGWPT